MSTIRDKLDLREQLEVIRIIDPDLTIDPIDTELVVGMLSRLAATGWANCLCGKVLYCLSPWDVHVV